MRRKVVEWEAKTVGSTALLWQMRVTPAAAVPILIAASITVKHTASVMLGQGADSGISAGESDATAVYINKSMSG